MCRKVLGPFTSASLFPAISNWKQVWNFATYLARCSQNMLQTFGHFYFSLTVHANLNWKTGLKLCDYFGTLHSKWQAQTDLDVWQITGRNESYCIHNSLKKECSGEVFLYARAKVFFIYFGSAPWPYIKKCWPGPMAYKDSVGRSFFYIFGRKFFLYILVQPLGRI